MGAGPAFGAFYAGPGRTTGSGPAFTAEMEPLPFPITGSLLRETAGRAHGTSHRMAQRLTTVEDVDLTVTGTTYLYTSPETLRMIPAFLVFRCTSATGFTSVAKVGAGVATGEEDAFAPQELLGLTAAGRHYIMPATEGGGAIMAPDTALYLGVDVAAVATTQLVAVDLFGYEIA